MFTRDTNRTHAPDTPAPEPSETATLGTADPSSPTPAGDTQQGHRQEFAPNELADQIVTTLTAYLAWRRFEEKVAVAHGTAALCGGGWGMDTIDFDEMLCGFEGTIANLLGRLSASLDHHSCALDELAAALQRARPHAA